MTLLSFCTPPPTKERWLSDYRPAGWSPAAGTLPSVVISPGRFPGQDTGAISGYAGHAKMAYSHSTGIPHSSGFLVGFALYLESSSGISQSPLVSFQSDWNGVSTMAELVINSSRLLIFQGDTLGMSPLATDTWHYIEVFFRVASKVGSDPTTFSRAMVRVNGELLHDSTGTSSPSGAASPYSLRGVSVMGGSHSSSQYTQSTAVRVCDAYVSVHSPDSVDWLGDVTVDRLVPNEKPPHPEYTTTFTPVNMVDEPADLAKTTVDPTKYIEASEDGARTSYAMTDFPAAGPSEVLAVMPLVSATKTGDGITTLTPFLREGDNYSHSTKGYLASGSFETVKAAPITTRPGGGEWTTAAIQNTEMGVTLNYE